MRLASLPAIEKITPTNKNPAGIRPRGFVVNDGGYFRTSSVKGYT